MVCAKKHGNRQTGNVRNFNLLNLVDFGIFGINFLLLACCLVDSHRHMAWLLFFLILLYVVLINVRVVAAIFNVFSLNSMRKRRKILH
jgi:hypothetical protein